jgi:hypothetical protein
VGFDFAGFRAISVFSERHAHSHMTTRSYSSYMCSSHDSFASPAILSGVVPCFDYCEDSAVSLAAYFARAHLCCVSLCQHVGGIFEDIVIFRVCCVGAGPEGTGQEGQLILCSVVCTGLKRGGGGTDLVQGLLPDD